METQSRYANYESNQKSSKKINKINGKNSKKKQFSNRPETKISLKNKNKRNILVKNGKFTDDELLIVGQGVEQVQLASNIPMKIVDLNQKIEKRLKILSLCNAQSSSCKDKLDTTGGLEAKFKILSPHLKRNVDRADEVHYVAYDIDDKVR